MSQDAQPQLTGLGKYVVERLRSLGCDAAAEAATPLLAAERSEDNLSIEEARTVEALSAIIEKAATSNDEDEIKRLGAVFAKWQETSQVGKVQAKIVQVERVVLAGNTHLFMKLLVDGVAPEVESAENPYANMYQLCLKFNPQMAFVNRGDSIMVRIGEPDETRIRRVYA